MGTFERKETKYFVSRDQYLKLCRLTAKRLVPPAEYAEGKVFSIYYDTADWLLINRSIEKPRYKEKLRVRAYGAVAPGCQVFVEIKKKFKGVVYKRRLSCSLEAAHAFLAGMPYTQAIERYPLSDAALHEGSLSWTAQQIAGEISWMLQSYGNLRPAMLIAASRNSLVGASDPELRVTADREVLYQALASDASAMPKALPLIGKDMRILEIKCLGAYPLWLVDALNACDILPQSISKVGLAYQAYCAQAAPLQLAPAAALAPAPRAEQASPLADWGSASLPNPAPSQAWVAAVA